LLMARNHMTEEEAHRYLQKTSMDSGRSFVESAQMILALLHS
ncbi:MAG: ANTAR domain-containing protein, partial [Clostridium sp.]|jgi:response regulator NasT|nr:ANTAR domain-containing protein [Clostridium sp.]